MATPHVYRTEAVVLRQRRLGAPCRIRPHRAAGRDHGLHLVALAIAATSMVLLDIVPPRDIYESIDWPVVVLLAAMIPISAALDTSGATLLAAETLVNLSSGYSPVIVLALILVVTMTLSDISSRLSAQWAVEDTVRVTRRLYRSGDSEYLINQKPTRLRDVVDLFLDTGLNTHSFSIVEQGRIEALLTARVEDRREVIEEAAGIMKYKTRRNEALRKLQAAKDNLDRINDIVGEVERQTRSLERQAKRASQYKEIQDRLREVYVLGRSRTSGTDDVSGSKCMVLRHFTEYSRYREH